MFKKFALGICIMLAVANGVANAGEPQQAPETKRIAIVYIQQVFKNYQYAKDTEEKIKTQFQADQKNIEKEVLKLQEMAKSLQNNPLKPQGSTAWRIAGTEISKFELEIQAMQEDFANRVREEEAAFWQKMYAAFQAACKAYAEYYNYDIIIAAPDPTLSEDVLKAMDPGAIQQEILMRRVQYVSDRANITKSITDLMNHRYKKHLEDPQKNPL